MRGYLKRLVTTGAAYQFGDIVAKGKATVTALATDALSPDARAVVQVGVECAA